MQQLQPLTLLYSQCQEHAGPTLVQPLPHAPCCAVLCCCVRTEVEEAADQSGINADLVLDLVPFDKLMKHVGRKVSNHNHSAGGSSSTRKSTQRPATCRCGHPVTSNIITSRTRQ